MKKAYALLSLGFINFLFSLTKFIFSINKEVYEDNSKNYSTNDNYIIWMISSLIIIYLGYIIYKEYKNKN